MLFKKINNINPDSQINKILEEVCELEIEHINNGRVLEESVDIIHSVITYLYAKGYTSKDIEDQVKKVQEKNELRGYYK